MGSGTTAGHGAKATETNVTETHVASSLNGKFCQKGVWLNLEALAQNEISEALERSQLLVRLGEMLPSKLLGVDMGGDASGVQKGGNPDIAAIAAPGRRLVSHSEHVHVGASDVSTRSLHSRACLEHPVSVV